MRQGKRQWLVVAALVALLATPVALAGPGAGKGGDVSEVLYDGRAAYWRVFVEHEAVVLSIHTPCGTIERVYKAGEDPVFSIDELEPDDPNGAYTWQVRVQPVVSAEVRKELARSRATGDDEIVRGLARKGLLPQGPTVQSGSFQVVDGVIVAPGEVEEGRSAKSLRGAATDAATAGVEVVTAADQVIPDDLIVQGSICVGFDCVNNESFGFDTIRLKENNTRIKFEDTSVGSFPTNDWQLTANDSASGGANKFSIEDITGANVPFTLTAGAPTNSLFVASTGRVGLRTATPVLDLHISTTNTPGIRLEQTSAGGFTAQTWDIAGNEANFFVRDVTGGSRLPLRIRPGAATSSLDIAATGFVGLGTASPDSRLNVEGTEDAEIRLSKVSGAVAETTFRTTATTNAAFFGTETNDVMAFVVNATERMRINTAGRVSIGCADPTTDFVVQSVTDGVATCATAPFSALTAGNTSFTASSSRTIKENIVPVPAKGILDKIAAVNVFNYDFIGGPKDRLGLMAEDFHGNFGRGTDKMLDGQDVQMALWLAVQELTKRTEQIQEQERAIAELRAELEAQKQAMASKD